MVGDVCDVIMCAKFQVEIFMGYDLRLRYIYFRFAACDRDLEIWVRGHLRSLKLVASESVENCQILYPTYI